MVAASFSVLLLCFVFSVGLDATPYDTTDSAGRKMGFNDRFSLEHYSIAFFNFRPSRTLDLNYWYEWILILMHMAGIVLLWKLPRSEVIVPTFFAFQIVLFPFSVLFFPILPFYAYDILRLTADREHFIDMPFVGLMAQPGWVLVSLTIFLLLLRRTRQESVPAEIAPAT